MPMRSVFRALPLALAATAALLTAGPYLAGCTKKEETPPAADRVPTPGEVFQQAVQQLRGGQVDEAVKNFTLIIEKAYPEAPERPMAHLYLGQIAYRAGNMDAAAANFEAALKLNPDIPQARLSLGNAYFAAGKLDEAIAAWEALAKDRPNLASVHNNLGIAYTDKGDLDQAIQHLEQTIALSPDNYRAHENLAAAYREKGMTEQADAADRKAKAIRSRLLARTPAAGGSEESPESPESEAGDPSQSP
jgi:tetratricopeptide (TPR) repeat protein